MKTITTLLALAIAPAFAQLPVQVDVYTHDLSTNPGLQWAQLMGELSSQGAQSFAAGAAIGLQQQRLNLERERLEWEKQKEADRLPSYREVHTQEADWRINQDEIDAYKAARAAHPDLDALRPIMDVIAQALRPDWRRITMKEYVESLYAIAKGANFAEPVRQKIAELQAAPKQP